MSVNLPYFGVIAIDELSDYYQADYNYEGKNIPLDLNLYNNGKPADSILISIKKGNEVIQTNTFNKKTILYLEPNTHYTFDCTKEGFNPEQFNIRTTNNKKPLRKSVNLTNY